MNQSYQSQQQISSSSANPKAARLVADYKQIILELRAQNFDVVRFATYRTASKLRFIQKKLNLHLIDLWNVIETFRDNNLHTLDIVSELDTSKIEACVQSMYLQLNKRLAYNQHINVESQTQLMMAWLLNLFDKNRLVKVRVLSLKVALTTMCAGKLVDKLKYIFTQISDQSKNLLVPIKFEMYLKDLLTLPKSVFEEPSFGYNENNTSRTCFDPGMPVRLDDFLSVALSDAGPPCFIWLNIFHRFTIVQNITHPVTCSACERSHFNGFRYKCQKCRKYQLCQDCFWRGRTTHSHQLTHQMKEYTCYKSAAKQFSNSLKRSFFCKPNRSSQLQSATNSNKYSSTSITTQPFSNKYISLDNDYPSPSRTVPNSAATPNYNSDYNILVATSSPGQNHHQQLASTNSCNLPPVLSLDGKQLSPTSIIKPKKITPQTSTNTNNVEEVYLSSDSIRLTDHTFDMKHIVPSSDTIKQTPSVTIVQPSNNKQQQSNNQTNTSSHSMTRSPNENINNTSSNLYLSYLLSNSPSTTINNEEEHGLIANYCSRLSNFYSKNPHLATESPTTPSPHHTTNTVSQSNSAYATLNSSLHKTTLNSNQKQPLKPSNLKQSTSRRSYVDDEDDDDEENEILRPFNHQSSTASRTASLQRHLWQSSRSSNKISQYNTLNATTSRISSNYDTSTGSLLSGKRAVNGQAKSNTKKKVVLTGLDDESSSDCPKNERGRSMSDYKLNGYSNHQELSPDAVRANKTMEERILKEKKEIVAKLERQNREIAKEIKRLKLKQKMTNTSTPTTSTSNSNLKAPVLNNFMEGGHISKSSLIESLSSRHQLKNLSDRSDLDSPKIAGATIIDPLIISLNEQQTQKKGYNKLKTSTLLNQTTLQQNSSLIAELQNLKNRKGQLENRMHTLLSSKDELQSQLKTLLKTSTTNSKQQSSNSLLSSPRSLTLNSTQKYNSLISSTNPYQVEASSSPVNAVPGLTDLYNAKTSSSSALSSAYQASQYTAHVPGALPASLAMQMPQSSSSSSQHQARQMTTSTSQHRSWSTPSTPALFELHPTRLANKTPPTTTNSNGCTSTTKLLPSVNGVVGGVASSLAPSTQSSMLSLNALSHFGNYDQSNATSNAGSNANLRSLRNDLLIAADSVTSAMQNLVKELNSENEENFLNTSDDEDMEDKKRELKSKGSLLRLNQNYQPPLYTSLSANATPLIYRKGFPGETNHLTRQPLYSSNGQLDDHHKDLQFNEINNNNINEESELSTNTLSKANLIKQLAQTFKDMNVNSEYDDVVNQLENELLTCEMQNDQNKRQIDEYEAAGQKTSSGQENNNHRKAVLIENMVLESNNDEEIENMIYEKFLMSKSYLEEQQQQQQQENGDMRESELVGGRERSQSEASHTERIITNILSSNQITNALSSQSNDTNNEQIASWRRELEQILVDEKESNNQIELELDDQQPRQSVERRESRNEVRQETDNNQKLPTSGNSDDSDEFSLL